jgi:hypothetical protein
MTKGDREKSISWILWVGDHDLFPLYNIKCIFVTMDIWSSAVIAVDIYAIANTNPTYKKEVPETDFQTGETGDVVPGKYKTRYLLNAMTLQQLQKRNSKPVNHHNHLSGNVARAILYYLSKDKNTLEVIRNGQPGSTSTTYQINPPLD